MEDWRYINSQRDIDEFVKETMGMHDSVMVGLDYMAGSWSDNMTTYFSGPNSKNLRVIFDSSWMNGKIEMIFETVCRFNIAGWQECYSDEILECSIKLEKLKKTSDETYVVWTAGGSPRAGGKEELLSEPIDTYIVSKRVRWRIAKLNYKCPCCGYYTFEHPPMGELDICPVCCWFDDTEFGGVVMPHVVVKLWPGRNDEIKTNLAKKIADVVVEELKVDIDDVSVAFEEVNRGDWGEQVYKKEIKNLDQ